MVKKNSKYICKKRGEVMITLVVLFMFISMVIILGLINPTLRNIKLASDLFQSKQSFYLSDSGMADAVYRVKNNMKISAQEVLSLNSNFATTTILDTIDGKTITSKANNYNYFRTIETNLAKGLGTAFFYGVQTGQGGFTMSGNSQVNGNVYSSGPIIGGVVTGSAVSAGATGTISGVIVGKNGVGDAHAHTVNNSTIAGVLKCKVGSNNNKTCDTSLADPDPLPLPVSDEQISIWKAEAEAGQIISGDYSPSGEVNLGPVKITGNFTVRNEVNMTGTIWVQGALSFSSSKAEITLDNGVYGSKSGVIIVDKYISFSGGSQIDSTGIPGSYVMLLVTSNCPISSFCSGNNAISVSGGSDSVLLAAPNGTVSFSGNTSAKEVVGNTIIMGGSSVINYETGLANLNFVSGPSGGYRISSFRETE